MLERDLNCNLTACLTIVNGMFAFIDPRTILGIPLTSVCSRFPLRSKPIFIALLNRIYYLITSADYRLKELLDYHERLDRGLLKNAGAWIGGLKIAADRTFSCSHVAPVLSRSTHKSHFPRYSEEQEVFFVVSRRWLENLAVAGRADAVLDLALMRSSAAVAAELVTASNNSFIARREWNGWREQRTVKKLDYPAVLFPSLTKKLPFR